jgi:hypothetical protein
MTTSNGVPAHAPLYVRVLRLRQLQVGGLASFVLFECMIAIGVLLALAELVSWWAVPILPAAVAVMVKVNDVVAGPLQRRRAAEQAGSGAALRAGQSARAAGGAGSGGARTTSGAEPGMARAAGGAEPGMARAASGAEPGMARAASGAESGAARAAGRGSRTASGRGGAESPAQGRPTQQPASRERLESAGAASNNGDAPQRRPVGVIRIAIPPRDGGVRTSDGAGGSTGRHARVQQTGRYADDGYVSNGRHSAGAGRTEDEITTRQRGAFNQGRFA